MLRQMLIERLQIVMDTVSHLTPEQQEKVAQQIEEVLDESLWDAQFADPRSEAFFDELVADAQRGPRLPFPTPTDMSDAEAEDEAE